MSRADRYQPLVLIAAIAAGLALSRVAPDLASSLSPFVAGGVLILIYLVMLSINLGDISKAFNERRFLGIAVGINFVVNPLLAWGLARLFLSGEPDLAVGLILFLVTPCIGWYLIFTELANGDTALGISLLSINLVLQVLLLPAYLFLFVGSASGVEPGSVVRSVVMFLVAPALAASATRIGLDQQAIQLERVQEIIDQTQLKTVALVAVVIAMFASQADVLFDNPEVVLKLLAPMLVFFMLAFSIALVAGRVAGLPLDQVALLIFTSTSRNSEASLAIAATAFASPLVGLTVVVGPIVELPLLVLMVRILIDPRLTTATRSSPQRTELA